ncbi:MAG: Gfo/Idh/MocA family oxidoreductase [Fusobacteriaceae bacterium]|jgi:predicted dehydrogenase|nr:Gfo/Idh/MocA family oxidoreductase [Fusobacteriaceae bacterium]
MKLKVCFCGMGSIGKRHLLNLITIGKEFNLLFEIDVIKRTNDLDNNIENLINKLYLNFNDIDTKYDLVFITNPTSIHYKTIRMMVNKTKHMFIEKPIFERSEYNLNELGLDKNNCYYVASPLRYSGVFFKLKEILKVEDIYSVRTICSSYLPDWRPQQNYRTVYSANKELGGGASIDLIHEWDYLVELFGFPQKIFNISGKYSSLEITSKDLSIYIAEYKDKLIELHLDYFGRIPKREIELFTEKGTIIGDFINKKISFTWKNEIIDVCKYEDMYVRELRNFFEIIYNKKINNNTPEHALKILKLAEGRI